MARTARFRSCQRPGLARGGERSPGTQSSAGIPTPQMHLGGIRATYAASRCPLTGMRLPVSFQHSAVPERGRSAWFATQSRAESAPSIRPCRVFRSPMATPHFGMNETIPRIALHTTSSAGFTLYWSKINNTPTAIAAVSTPKIAPFAMVKQPASSSPIETGARPC